MVFFFVIVLTVLAVGLLIAAAVSKKHRRRLVLAAILVLLYAFWRAVTSSGFLNGLVAIASSIAIVGALAYWFFHMIDAKSEKDGKGSKLLSGKRGVLGKVGVAVTPLRPTGQADIDGSRLVVSTEGEYIAAGSYVRVVAKDRKQYFVRLAEPSEFINSVMSDGGV